LQYSLLIVTNLTIASDIEALRVAAPQYHKKKKVPSYRRLKLLFNDNRLTGFGMTTRDAIIFVTRHECSVLEIFNIFMFNEKHCHLERSKP